MNSRRISASALFAIMIIASMLIEAALAKPAPAMHKSPSQKKASYYTCLMDLRSNPERLGNIKPCSEAYK